MQYNCGMIQLRKDNKFFVILLKITNRQFIIGCGNYFVTFTIIFSYPSLAFLWYYSIIVTVLAVFS